MNKEEIDEFVNRFNYLKDKFFASQEAAGAKAATEPKTDDVLTHLYHDARRALVLLGVAEFVAPEEVLNRARGVAHQRKAAKALFAETYGLNAEAIRDLDRL